MIDNDVRCLFYQNLCKFLILSQTSCQKRQNQKQKNRLTHRQIDNWTSKLDGKKYKLRENQMSIFFKNHCQFSICTLSVGLAFTIPASAFPSSFSLGLAMQSAGWLSSTKCELFGTQFFIRALTIQAIVYSPAFSSSPADRIASSYVLLE